MSKISKLITIISVIILLSGCSTYWIKGEQHRCTIDDAYFYGYNCPKCNRHYLEGMERLKGYTSDDHDEWVKEEKRLVEENIK